MLHNYITSCISIRLHQFSTSSGGAFNISVHSLSFLRALTAVFLIGHTTGCVCSSDVSSLSFNCGLSETVFKVSAEQTSRGYNCAIGRFVLPALVQMFAALTNPSDPLITPSITANCHFILGVSSCTKTTSPIFTCWMLLPVVL